MAVLAWTSSWKATEQEVSVEAAHREEVSRAQRLSAKLAESEKELAERDKQVASLESAITRSSQDLASKNSAIAQLTLVVQQMKVASGLVEKTGRDLLLTLSDQNSVNFDVAQEKLSCEQRERLAENLTLLRYAKSFPDFAIEITGHTDDTWHGRQDHSDTAQAQNKALSERRAAAVEGFLREHNIPPDKIKVEGKGMRWPVGATSEVGLDRVASFNKDDAARRQNRRVEVLIKGVDLKLLTVAPDPKQQTN